MEETRKRTGPPSKFPPEVKERVLAALAAGVDSQETIARRENVSLSTLQSWVKAKRRESGEPPARPGPKAAPGPVSELQRLRERVIELEHEAKVLEEVIVDQVLQIRHLKAGQR